MRGHVIRPAGDYLSFRCYPSAPPKAYAFLGCCRYHLVRNVIPTLLGLLIMGGITLFLSAHIYAARMDRQQISSGSMQERPQKTPDLAKEVLKFKL